MGFSTPATYKKNAGTLQADETDENTIKWMATGENNLTVSFPVASIDSLDQTPASSAKNILKVTSTVSSETSNYLFSFSSRDLLDSTRVAIQGLVQARRTAAEEAAKAEQAKASAAAAASQSTANEVTSLDAKSLLQNHALQQKLLKENKELMKTFHETVITGGIPPKDFWSNRIVLLRSFAFAHSQKRGRYNVLSTIKPTVGDNNQLNVSLSREKIHDIFEQYPIVRRAYNDNVPNINEGNFWARFFNSRLYRKLKGEKISPNDAIDGVLDKYLTLNEEAGQKRKAEEEENYHVPQYLDIEGNSENSSETMGNRPDLTMQPGKSGQDTVSLIRSMNNLSQRMLYSHSSVLEVDNPKGTDLDDQLKLSDLGEEELAAKRRELQLNQPSSSSLSQEDLESMADGGKGKPRLTLEELSKLQKDMHHQLEGELDLSNVSRDSAEIKAARDQINETIRLRAREVSQNIDSDEKWGGDKRLLDQIQICHATSIEFLRHFWIHFQSGDPNQAASIQKLASSLEKSLTRVEAIVRQGQTEDDQRKVKTSFQPLVTSIGVALEKYRRALSEVSSVSS